MALWKFLNQNCKIAIGTETVTPTNGVMQGSRIAPMLFSVYMESLIDTLKPYCEDLTLFVDDVVIICKSQSSVVRCQANLLKWT